MYGAKLPDLPTDRRSPVELLRLVVLWDPRYELLEVESAPHSPHRRNNEQAVLCRDVDLVPNVNMNAGEQFLAEAKTLAVAPLLDLGEHFAPPMATHSIAL